MEYGIDDADNAQSDDVSSIEPVEPDPDPLEEPTEDFTEPPRVPSWSDCGKLRTP